jgi:uncharacterized membrane protein
MSWQPIADAGLATQVHLATVIAAFAIGTWMIVRPKGTPPHKALGRIFIVLTIATAVSTFWIHSINRDGFSPLHLLAIYVLLGAPYAWWHARHGNIRRHRNAMISLYVGGIWIAGLFTLLPGRVLHEALFGS